MEISRSAIHDQLIAVYQSLEAAMLSRVLQANGVQDRELRRRIVGEFLFEQGVFLDQFWFAEETSRLRFFPGVYFSSHRHDEIANAVVHLPSQECGMNFHEYAFGAADWALDDHEINGDDIPSGNAYEEPSQ